MDYPDMRPSLGTSTVICTELAVFTELVLNSGFLIVL